MGLKYDPSLQTQTAVAGERGGGVPFARGRGGLCSMSLNLQEPHGFPKPRETLKSRFRGKISCQRLSTLLVVRKNGSVGAYERTTRWALQIGSFVFAIPVESSPT